jgi:hypothetical protein
LKLNALIECLKFEANRTIQAEIPQAEICDALPMRRVHTVTVDTPASTKPTAMRICPTISAANEGDCIWQGLGTNDSPKQNP